MTKIDSVGYLYQWVVEFLVISITFFLSCSIVSTNSGGEILSKALIFALLVTVSLNVVRRIDTSIKKLGMPMLELMIRNAVGLILSMVVLLLANSLLSEGFIGIVESVVACIASFFVLGTLIPLVQHSEYVARKD